MPDFLCPIKRRAKLHPYSTAIHFVEKSITYKELDERVEIAQKKLLSLKTARIGIYHPPDIRLIYLLFGAFRAKIAVFLANSRVPFSVIEKKAEELGVTRIVGEAFSLDNFFALPESNSPLNSDLSTEEISLFTLTSGSTHTPKIAALSLGNFYYNAVGTIPAVSLEEGDTWLLSLPLFHVGGIALLFRVFLSGSALALLPKEAKLFSKITHISFVPTQLFRALQDPESIKNLKCLLLGGASISPELYRKGVEAALPLYLTYGLTEMSSSVLIHKKAVIEDNLLYLGDPLPHREMKLLEGEILVRGKTLFQGYWKEGKIDPIRDAEGWFSTKDLAKYKKGLGYAILGRKDRLFISGGENIQPEEIERILLENPNIEEAYVLPCSDEEFGEVPVLFTRMKKKVSLSYIQESLKERLPSYKIPRAIFNLEEDFFKPDFKKMMQIANQKGGKKT